MEKIKTFFFHPERSQSTGNHEFYTQKSKISKSFFSLIRLKKIVLLYRIQDFQPTGTFWDEKKNLSFFEFFIFLCRIQDFQPIGTLWDEKKSFQFFRVFSLPYAEFKISSILDHPGMKKRNLSFFDYGYPLKSSKSY